MSDIEVERRSETTIIKLNRPEKRNAVSFAMWKSLSDLMEELGRSSGGPRILVLTGGRHFSAGADISEFPQLRANDAQTAAYEAEVERCYTAILNASKPVIAAISGVCVGGGCALALACDFRVADATARIGIPAAKLGVVYTPLETRLLYNQVGLANAKRILFGGELISAETALNIGFMDHVTAEGDVVQSAIDFAGPMRKNAPLSIAAAKKILRGLSENTLERDAIKIARLTERAIASDDYKEGVAAFLEKRSARFTGN